MPSAEILPCISRPGGGSACQTCEAGLAFWPAAETDCGFSINHWRPLWHQERAETGAQLAERESLRRTGTLTHQQFFKFSPGFKRWCYELTRRKDSADEAGPQLPSGLFSSYFLTYFPLWDWVSSASHDAGLYGENALQNDTREEKTAAAACSILSPSTFCKVGYFTVSPATSLAAGASHEVGWE